MLELALCRIKESLQLFLVGCHVAISDRSLFSVTCILHFSYSNACTIISNLSRSLTNNASGVLASSYSCHKSTISLAVSVLPRDSLKPSMAVLYCMSMRVLFFATMVHCCYTFSRWNLSSLLTPACGVMSPYTDCWHRLRNSCFYNLQQRLRRDHVQWPS